MVKHFLPLPWPKFQNYYGKMVKIGHSVKKITVVKLVIFDHDQNLRIAVVKWPMLVNRPLTMDKFQGIMVTVSTLPPYIILIQ